METSMKRLTIILFTTINHVTGHQTFKKHVSFKGTADVIREIKTNSLIKCAAKCAEYEECAVFDFDPNKMCETRCRLLGNHAIESETGYNNIYFPIKKGITPIYYFLSQNFPTYGLCPVEVTNSYLSKIIDGCKEYFKILSPGLSGADGTISIQSVTYPNRYWHASARGATLYFDDRTTATDQAVFDQHATFILHIDQMYTGYYTFESVEYLGYYVRHYGFVHKLHPLENTGIFYSDASLKAESNGHFLIE